MKITLGTAERTEKEAQSVATGYPKTSCKHYGLMYPCGTEPFTKGQEGLQPELNLIASARLPSGSVALGLQFVTAKLYHSDTCYIL